MVRPPANLYTRLPDVPRGAPLGDVLSIIVPEATTNLVTNPSVERATTGYTASNGSSIARSTDAQAFGAYSLAVTPSANVNSGVYYTPGAVTATQVYTYAVYVKAAPGVPMRITIADSSANILNRLEFRGTGRWRRYWVNATPGVTAIRLYVEKNNSTSTAVFYVDALQLEAKAYPTTYTDGDMRGFVPTRNDFYWTGAPHASTSVRSAQTRAGGRPMNFARFGVTILSILGLGMTPWSEIARPAGLLGGSYYQRSVPQGRQFTVLADMREASRVQLDRQQASLIDVLRPDLVTPTQPIVLRYQQVDACTDEPLGDALDIQCGLVPAGPGNTIDNEHQETTPLTFTQYLPQIFHELSGGAALDYQDTVADTHYLAKRSTTGLWSALGLSEGSGGGAINAIAENPIDGRVYIGGTFTNLNGDANMDGIAVYDPATGTLSAVGTGVAGGDVHALAVDASGNVWAGGTFTSAGGVANTDGVAYFNISTSTWTAAGTGVSSGTVQVSALLATSDGRIYAGGAFTGMGGVANTTRLAYWTGSAWAAMGTGANSDVLAFTQGLDGIVYIGGGFTTLNGVSNAKIGRWQPSTSSGAFLAAINTNTTNTVNALLTLPDGTIVVAGVLTELGSVAVEGIAVWNGTTFLPLGPGLETSSGGEVSYLAYDHQRAVLYATGTFNQTADAALTFTGGFAVWNGTSWVYGDVTMPGSAIGAIGVTRAGELLVGGNSAGTMTSAGVTTLSVAGAADTYPRLELVGPGRVYQLANITAGRAIYFNLTLQAGERATLELRPDRISFVSTLRGDISHLILPGSQTSNWALQADTNSISLYIGGTTTAATAATITWQPVEASVQGGTY